MRAFIPDLDRRTAQHPGLLLERYFTAKDVTAPQPDERERLLVSATTAARDPGVCGLYAAAYTRWDESLPPDTIGETLATPPFARLVVGLGQESVLETGLRLHHTYGLPVIPGSGLKGLASHYCHTVWGQAHDLAAAEENKKYRREGPYHDLLFGYTRGPDKTDGGAITFHDAWITPDSLPAPHTGVLRDVMTPHHPKWQDGTLPPTDFDSPVPVSFLSVAGAFRVAVSWNGPADHDRRQNWTELAFTLLKEALWEWGVGGKTSSGYGRLGDAAKIAESVATRPTESADVPSAPVNWTYQDRVKVKVLERRDNAGRAQFRVQEEGHDQPGWLMYGTPPAKLPEVETTITIHRNNTDKRNPQYRWDPLPPAGGQRPRR